MSGFEKTRRLQKKSEYNHVFAKANKTIITGFIILHCKNSEGHARLGMALSKKMIAKAFQRNRIKRLLRESFRTHQLPAVDIIILARKGIAAIENKALTVHLGNAWNQLAAYYEK